MHTDVNESATSALKKQVDTHNRRTKVQKAHFEIGDFVLVRRTRPGGHKLTFSWCGPRRVTEIKSEWVCVVQNILNGKKAAIHTRRLHPYRADMDGAEVSPLLVAAVQHTEAHYQAVEAFREIREVDGVLKVKVECQCLPDEVDMTREPVRQIHEHTPGLLEDYLHSSGERKLKRRALHILNWYSKT